MPLSLFIDALPYNEMKAQYSDWFKNIQMAELLPNVGYSSSLHWQLYCDRYPDERGVFVDWVRKPEKRADVKLVARLLSPLDRLGSLGFLSRKIMNRYVFRRNIFANIPYCYRGMFSEEGKYLFWDKSTYSQEAIFDGYTVVSQDEGHLSFNAVMEKFRAVVNMDKKDLFVVLGFADAEGHVCRRGELYSQRLHPYMEALHKIIKVYMRRHPDEEVLIVSDHGMSTVEHQVDLELERHFGKPGRKSYVAYCDTAIMCIWVQAEELRKGMAEYLATKEYGHLLTDSDRQRFGITDPLFGDIIFNLREGYVFADNWFGKSIRKPRLEGSGMHGFWPERSAHDQMACVMIINGKRKIEAEYDYKGAHKLINEIMQGDRK